MVLSVKARLQQLDEASGPNETRRFLISSSLSLKEFCKKLEQIFPSLLPNTYKLCWKDEENDDILISSDEELAVAISQAQNDLLKVFVTVTSKPAPKSPVAAVAGTPPPSRKSPEKSSLKEPQQQKAEPTKPATPVETPSSNEKPKAQGKSSKSNEVFHSGVLCDGCDKQIWGYRYKCMECDNYDLCSACNEKNVHPNHNMWKFASPPDSSFWTFMTVSDTLRRFFGLVSGGFSQATSASRHGRRGRNCRWANGNAPSSANNSGCAKPASEKPSSNQSQEDLLRGVGETVAAMLDPLGINVDVDVEHSNGEREHIHSTKEARNEPKQTPPPPPFEPVTATLPPEFVGWSEPVRQWYQANVCIPPSSIDTDNSEADAPLPELSKTPLTTQSTSVQTTSTPITNQTSNTSTEVQTDFCVDCQTIPKQPLVSASTSTTSEGALGGEAKIEKDSSGEWDILGEPSKCGVSEASLNDFDIINPLPQGAVPKTTQMTNIYPRLPSTESQPQPAPISPRIAAAVSEILSMGFSDEQGWLTRMVQANNGDVAVVLDKLLGSDVTIAD